MSPIHRVPLLVLLLASVSLAGCAAGLLALKPPATKQGEDWGPTGRQLYDIGPAVHSITYGPRPGRGLWGPMFATMHFPSHPRENCVQSMRFSHPQVTLWDELGVRILSLENSDGSDVPLRFTGDDKIFVFGSPEGLMFWDMDKRTLRNQFPLEPDSHFAISDDCRLIAVQRYDERPKRIRICNIDDGVEQRVLNADGTPATPQAFLDAGRKLAAVGWEAGTGWQQVVIWDLTTGKRTGEFSVDPRPLSYAFSSDGRLFASESSDHAIEVRETISGKIIHTTGKHSHHVRSIAFSPDSRLLASGSEEGADEKGGRIKVWNAVTGAELATLVDDTSWGVTALTFSPDATELASGNGSGQVRFWKVPAAAVSSLAQSPAAK